MKTTITKIIFSLFLLLVVGYSFAQSPQFLNYQAVARDVSGNVLDNQSIKIRFTIHKGSAAGVVSYSEVHNPLTNEFGLFTLMIGSGTEITSQFDTIAWGKNQYWLQVEMDPTISGTYTDMGTSQLLSVPYALYAEESGTWRTSGNDIYSTNTGAVHVKDKIIPDNKYTNNALPIAYGNISSGGTLSAGTSNISAVTWNATSSHYEITITGVSYNTGTYVTIVTPRANHYIPYTSSVSGNLVVSFINISGTAVQTSFQFVTYKP